MWSRRLAGAEAQRSLGAVALAGSQVVVATRGGDLYGVDIDTGYTTWAVRLGKRVVAQPIVAAGWVYASTTDGHVVAVEVGDHTLDGWHMWGGVRRTTPVAIPSLHATCLSASPSSASR